MRSIATLILSSIVLLAGCHKAFDYSPYEGDVPDSYSDLNTQHNMDWLRSLGVERSNVKIGLIADSHYSYDELRDAIRSINADTSISFVFFCGDYSDQGLTREYMIFHDELSKLAKPFFTVIGSHDYLAGGEEAYSKLFGARNYVLDYSSYRFIFFDDVFWESGHNPDFNWLSQQLDERGTRQPFLIAHLPPDAEQFDTVSEVHYQQLMENAKVPVSIHGHVHDYAIHYGTNTRYLIVPATVNRQYCTINLNGALDTPIISLVNF